jgi:TM2 domain-containing membrane protein YozV
MQNVIDGSSRFCLLCGFENPAQYTHCERCGGENPTPIQTHHVPLPVFTQIVVNIPKSRTVYIVLGIFFGWIGVHNFYANRKGVGATQLVLFLMFYWTLIAPVGLFIWSVIDIINVRDDGNGIRMR